MYVYQIHILLPCPLLYIYSIHICGPYYPRRTKELKERRQPQRGIRTALGTRRGCEAEERYVLAYAFINSDLIRTPH